jgi:hypothetical protein
VRFNEEIPSLINCSRFPDPPTTVKDNIVSPDGISPAAEIEDEDSLDAEFQTPPLIEHPIGEEPTVAVQLEHAAIENLEANPSVNSSRPQRQKKPVVRWSDESLTGIYAGLASVGADLTEPVTYEDALSSPQ